MLISTSVLLLSAVSPTMATDITPMSLATRPHIVTLVGAPYDWNLQRMSIVSGQKLADSTANCNTATIETNSGGKTDQVHDCGFD